MQHEKKKSLSAALLLNLTLTNYNLGTSQKQVQPEKC